MKRGIKRLLHANKIRVVIYLLVVVFFAISLFSFSFSLLRLIGIETLIRIIVILLFILYFIFLCYKGYIYIVKRNKIKYFILMFLSIIISIALLVITYFINVLYGGIDNLTLEKSGYYTGYLISLKDTEKKDLEILGLIKDVNDQEGYIIANNIIKDEKINSKIENYNSYEDMLYDLYNGNIDGAFVQSNYVSYFLDIYNTIENDTKVVYKKTEKLENENFISSNKTLDEPFTVLLMGVDSTENSINTNTVFNGDTLMLLTFNPKTLNATIFSIPRDLYVPITCKNDVSAKINSASVGGVSCVSNTIKKLMDINIDYYAKINFKGVVDLVDALDGVEVDVPQSFCEQDSNRDFTNQICLKKGFQKLNGEEALAFARHRKSYVTGDLMRIQNQQLIVEALTKKALSLNTITDFSDIMNAISNNIVTNMSTKEMLSSYNILKSMILNVISDKDALVVEKSFLEVYDMNIYNNHSNSYISALGYYKNSLEDIVEKMKINLEIKKPELIKAFDFDANSPYVQKVAGEGLKNDVSVDRVIDFTNKSITEVEKWANSHNIKVDKKYVTEGDSNYNVNVLNGLVGNQNIKAGTIITGIKSITIYINTVSD